jgi:gliding motility-associated-like protein
MYSNYECIDLEPQMFVPNSFTPNGDGLNDKFLPSIMGIVSYDMKVFNRWGQLVYSGNTPWDGMINGQATEADVFMYSIHIMRNDRNSEFYKGMVHLIR